MSGTRLVVPALVLSCLIPETAFAQRKSSALVGWIRDSTGAPVVGADISLAKKDIIARTDSAGQFRFRGLDAGQTEFHVRRLGYAPQVFEVALHENVTDSVDVRMSASAALLDAVQAKSAVGLQYHNIEEFYKRRAKGGGHYFTRDEIEARHTSVLSEVLRTTPGVRIVRATRRSSGGLRFSWATNKSYDCPPQIWLDGRRLRSAEVDDFPASDVEAVELYSGPAAVPVQFSLSDPGTCGTVIIWTRIPGDTN